MSTRTSAVTTARHLVTAGGMLFLVGSMPACVRSSAPHGAATTPRSAARTEAAALLAQQLLAADREWSRNAAQLRFPDALAPMFASSVKMPLRDRIVEGSASVLGAFETSADTGAAVRWVPVRVGIAADGQHGFTAGVQLLTRRDGTRTAARYLAFWTREAQGGGDARWAVVAWRRRPLSHASPDTTMLPAILPAALVTPNPDHAALGAHYRSLIAAEQAFSDEADRIGVGAAFARLGDAEALNMGRPDDAAFARGPAAIAALVAGGQPLDAPSTIRWNADTAIVATSGDLGITFGVIRPKHAPNTGAPSGAAFFTIWRRASPDAPWRYIAE